MTAKRKKSPPQQHTPGPWQYDPKKGLVHSLDETLICDLCPDEDSPDTPEHHANGSLIDSAPELLEGAEAVVLAFDKLIPHLPPDFRDKEGRRLSIAIESLREPIIQARIIPK